MELFEYLYGRRYWSPIGWFDFGNSSLLGHEIIYESLEKVQVIRDTLKTPYSRKKSYADNRKRDLEFEMGDHVYLNILL